MDIRITDVCRGDCKAFFHLEAGGLDDAALLSLRATVEGGGEVPLMAFPDRSARAIGRGTSERRLVVALPLLERDVCLTAVAATPQGDGLAREERVFSPSGLKWLSRLNGRLIGERVDAIRDCDGQKTLGRANFQLVDCLDCASEGVKLLRGVMRVPCSLSDEPPVVRCFDEHVRNAARDIRMYPPAKRLESASVDAPFWEIPFSVAVELEGETVVLGAYRSDGSAVGGFATLSRGRLDEMCGWFSFRVDTAFWDPGYDSWFRVVRMTEGERVKQSELAASQDVKFSVVVPLYRTPAMLFDELVESVERQTYANWELVLVNASPEDGGLSAAAREAAAADERIVVVELDENRGITLNTNAGVERATGDFIAFCDHDDVLEPDILFEYAKAVRERPDTDLLYCDEDKIDEQGRFVQPFFKPDFSIDHLRANNYVCHMLAVRATVLRALPAQGSEFDGAQDYNLTLMASEVARHVHHVPKVLYHWRMVEGSTSASTDNKPYVTQAGTRALQGHLARLGIRAEVSPGKYPFMYRVRYAVQGEPLVSIVIPNCECADILDQCLRSIRELTTYANYEVVVVENNSSDPATFDYYKRAQRDDGRVRVVRWEGEGFNFSQIVNFGVEQARGDYLLLLNNDVEVISPAWIEEMLGVCQRDEVGAVGAKLLYPDGTIQHAGVVLSDGAADHIGRFVPRSYPGYFQFHDITRDLSAVTAACLMTKRSVFDEVAGFDEEFAVAFNDIDFCLRVRKASKLVVYVADAELYHYESFSRGLDIGDARKEARLRAEAARLVMRWAELFAQGDPYFNPNFNPKFPDAMYYRLKPLYLMGRS